MPDTTQLIEETLSESLDDILFTVGKGIAAAQLELDRNSLATQVLIDNNATLSDWGVQASWYHFPETTIEVRLSLSLHWQEIKREGAPSYWKLSLLGTPHNASYQNQFNYDASGSSVVKVRIVSVPPQRTIQEGGQR